MQEEQRENDDFDAILSIQNQYYTKGYNKARNDQELDKNAEKKHNYDQGLATGKQLGLEIGYYIGYLEEIQQVLPVIDEYLKHTAKVDQLIEDVQEIILSVNPEEGNVVLDELPNTILLLRSKFKTLLLSLGFKKPDFNFNSRNHPRQAQVEEENDFDF